MQNQGLRVAKAAHRKESIRSSHACEPCRRRRAKCDGVQPRCARCSEINTLCLYTESKAQRHQREKFLSSKASLYENLLRTLLPMQNEDTQRQIRSALDDQHAQAAEPPALQISSPNHGVTLDENTVNGDVGSPQEQDIAAEISCSEGYIGKSSAVRWLNDLGDSISRKSSQLPSAHAQRTNSSLFGDILNSASTWHVGAIETEVFTNLIPHGDLKALPSKWQADKYLQVYLETVQLLFQVIDRDQFVLEYENFWSSGVPPEGGVRWQALLNIILAIGCVHANRADSPNNSNDDIQLFLRARMLSLEPLCLMHCPDRLHVQLTTLFAMYLLASNRINSAWLMIGNSIRYAQNLGLHLLNVDEKVAMSNKELQTRLWHTITSMECLLCFLTGRPVSIREDSSSAPLPVSLDEHIVSSNTVASLGSTSQQVSPQRSLDIDVFCRSVLLDRILADTLIELYSAGTVSKAWVDIQRSTSKLNAMLLKWGAELPRHYGLRDFNDDDRYPYSLASVYFNIRYCSVDILINRLSICGRSQTARDAMPDQSKRSQEVDCENARRAIHASQGMIRMLHGDDFHPLYKVTPWWSIVHYITQACSVLVVEIYNHAEHVPGHRDEIIQDAYRGIQLLNNLPGTLCPARSSSAVLAELLNITLSQQQEE